MSNSLQPHGLQYTRLPYPSLSPRVGSNSCPLSWWCYLSNHLILCLPLLLLPSISQSKKKSCLQSKDPESESFPMNRVFSNELALRIRSFSFSISPSNEYSGLISFRMDWFDLLAVQGLSRVFSSTAVRKHHFFGTQPCLLFNSHIHTWLLEKPQLGLDRPLSAKWCLCFLICCLGLS